MLLQGNLCIIFTHIGEPLKIGFFSKAKSSTTGRFSTHELRGYYLVEEQLVKTNFLSINEGLSTIKGSCNFLCGGGMSFSCFHLTLS